MKHTHFYFLILLFGFAGQAQITLKYTYDEAGNQYFRQEKISIDNDESRTLKPTEPNSEIFELLTTEEINNKFQVSPNPTSGFAELSWDSDISESITKIELVSLISNERTNVSFSGNNAVGIDLSRKVTGLYVVLFHLNNKKVSVVQKKIVKY